MFCIEEASILEIQGEIERGNLSSVELVKYYIQRITKHDRDGIKLNSILEINPDLYFIAEALDKERARKGPRGLMHGIPVVIKDNINTGDKMHTSAGSLALADSYAPEDAFIVKKLREAGAIVMGKTNMTEFANFMAEKMPAGYSSRGGQVLNPYDIEKTPSGSSSGSAVAVSANLCTVAVGTETNGSILSPSRTNCIVGIKPTVGLVSRNGIIPISHSQDTAGPMGRTVSDAAILLGTMIGADENDPAAWLNEGIYSENFINAFSDINIEGVRIGVSTVFYDKFTAEEQNMLDRAVEILQQKGAVIVKQDKISKGLPEAGSSVCLHEFKAGINYYLSKLGHPKIKTLADIIEFNRQNAEKTLRFGQKILEMSEQTSGTLTEIKYLNDRIRDIEHSRTNGIDKIMDEYKLDALLFLERTSLAAISGYPTITVPSGIINNTPYGLEFISKPFTESFIIKLAFVYEQATKHRVAPVL